MTAAILPWRVAGWAAALPARPTAPSAPLRTVERGTNALNERDHDAWNQLFDQHGPDIYRYMVSRLGDHQRAEDATSEVFEAAWKSAESFEDQGLPPRAWLFGIARHIVANHRRRWSRRAPEITLDAFSDASSEAGPTPDRLDLARAIARLAPAHAAVITLRFIHGLTLKETAGALNITPDAVKGRQLRALEALRSAMGPC